MELGLQGKVAVITGGTSGIGLAAALEFAREGSQVAICGKNESKVAAAAATFQRQALPVVAERVDVSLPQEISQFAAAVVGRFGRIDVWVNNAGMASRTPLLDLPLEDWELVLRTNLTAVFWGIRTAAGYMRTSGGGAIINTSSFAAVIPSAGGAAYAASKSGLSGLTKVAAGELAPYRIRVNSVLPGPVDTPMMKTRLATDSDRIVAKVALQRVGHPVELAKVYTFLASDAASLITGAAFEVSGGKLCIQEPQAPWTVK